MYILVDVIAVLFVLGLSLYGLKIGFFKSLIDVVLVIGVLGGAGILSYFTIFALDPLWLEEIQNFYLNILGNSKVSGMQETIEQVAFYLGFGTLMLVFFIGYNIVLNIVRKIIVKFFEKVNSLGFFGFFDKLLGFVINLAFSAGVVLLIMAFIYNLSFMAPNNYAQELILSTEILSTFYETNPLNFIFEGLTQLLPA